MKHIDDFKQTAPDTWLVDAWTVYPQRKVRVELVRVSNEYRPTYSVVFVQESNIHPRQTLMTGGVNECIQTALHLTQTVIG